MLHKGFYSIKPFIPRKVQIALRRKIASRKRVNKRATWPIDPCADQIPDGWKGWPQKKKFTLVISHDVDTQKGHDVCRKLMDLEEKMGFKSTFNIVPERYNVSRDLIEEIKSRGFQVSVHGLKHDGKLFSSRSLFEKRAREINTYLKSWGTQGFTTPSMIRNLDWMHALDIKYSTSTFDTDPFEPQPEGVCTIFPYKVHNETHQSFFVELPYTLPQDHALYIILQEKSDAIWREKLTWIVQRGGMALFNSHPDYMNFSDTKLGMEEYPVSYFTGFLQYIKDTYAGQYWNALPREVAAYIANEEIRY